MSTPSDRSLGVTLLETIFTTSLILVFVIILYFFSLLLPRVRIELADSYLAPGSQSQVNKQLAQDQVNILFLEMARDLRNASKVAIDVSTLHLTFPNEEEVHYFLEERVVAGRTIHLLVRSTPSNTRIMVQGVRNLSFLDRSGGEGKMITVQLTIPLGDREHTFSTTLLKRNPSLSK